MAFIIDNFVRPDGVLGGIWGPVHPSAAEFAGATITLSDLQISNHGVGPILAHGGDSNVITTGTAFQNDQWAFATLKTVAPYTSTVAITAAVFSAGSVTYTYTLTAGAALISGQEIIITGMADAGNNSPAAAFVASPGPGNQFLVSGLGSGTFTVVNASGVTRAGQSGTGVSPSDSGAGVMVRGTADGLNGYFYHVGTNSFSGDGRVAYHELWKVVAGVGTFLDGSTYTDTALPLVGETLAISAIGTKITAWKNGVSLFSVTDAALASGVPGLWAFAVGGAPEYAWSTWNSFTNPPGNNGTTLNNFQATDSNFTLTQLASDALTEGATVLLTDSFTYANGDLHTLNANWGYEGVSTFQVASDVVYSSHAGINSAYRSDVTWPANQSVTVTAVVTGNSGTQNGGPAVRVSASVVTFYGVQYSNVQFNIIKEVAGSFTTIATGATFPTTGQTVTLAVIGTTLTAYINGVLQLTVTDTSIASGNAGIWAAGNATINGYSSWSGSSESIPAQFTVRAGTFSSDVTAGAYATSVDGSQFAIAYQNTGSFTTAQYSQATLAHQGPSSDHYFGPAVYVSSSADTLYWFPAVLEGGVQYARIYAGVAGVNTQLASVAHAFADGEVYRLEVYPLTGYGNYLVGSINGTVVLSVVDSTFAITSGSAGFTTFNVVGSPTLQTMKNWSGGSIAALNPASGPVPASISPASDAQGFTGNVTVSGTAFDSGGTSTLSFSGTGITVNSYGTRNATTLTANITITSSAALTARDVVVTNADASIGTLAAAFTITFGGGISGSVGAAGAGATITLSGAGSATTTADSSGNFSFTGLAPGTYVVTPSMIGRAFAPSTQTVVVATVNVSGINFLTFRPQRSTAIFITNMGPLLIR